MVRAVCPVEVLAGPAQHVQADVLARVRDVVLPDLEPDWCGAAQRIGAYLEDGLSLLFKLQAESESPQLFDVCRRVAEMDGRFAFIYRMPSSAGFGSAIAATIQHAVYGKVERSARDICALLNAFMTVLDGLLDEVPSIMEPHRETLLDLVRTETSRDIDDIAQHQRNPLVALCFFIAQLWLGKLRDVRRNAEPHLEAAFARAATEAMLAEYATAAASFANGFPNRPEVLWGRTRWPHWSQALACTLEYGIPRSVDFSAFRELIFKIGDYAAFLDDICDYLMDCQQARWNTMSCSYLYRFPCSFTSVDNLQRYLLVSLSTERFLEMALDSARTIVSEIKRWTKAAGLNFCDLRPLLTDLTYGYVGR